MPPRLIMLGSVLLFSLSHACVKLLGRIPVFEVAFARGLVSLVFCLFFLYRARIPFRGSSPRVMGLLASRGFLGAMGMTCFFYTLKTMPLATAVTIHYLTPLFAVMISALVLKEAPSRIQVTAFFLGFLGVFLTQGVSGGASVLSTGAGVLSALFVASAYNLIRKLGREHPLIPIVYLAAAIVLVNFIPLIWAGVMPNTQEFLALGLMGALAHGGQYLLTLSYQRNPAAQVADVGFMGVISAVAIGMVGFGEVPNHGFWAGAVLIVGATLLNSDWRKTS